MQSESKSLIETHFFIYDPKPNIIANAYIFKLETVNCMNFQVILNIKIYGYSKANDLIY